ncbi:MAG: hypothetical protein AAB732_02050 [Patescibacteria group bacterium]
MKKNLKFSSIIILVLSFLLLTFAFTPLMARTVKMLKDVQQDVFNVIGKLVVDGDAEIKGNFNVNGNFSAINNLFIGGHCTQTRCCTSWSDSGYTICAKTGPTAVCNGNTCGCSSGFTKLSTGSIGYGMNATWYEYYICVKN